MYNLLELKFFMIVKKQLKASSLQKMLAPLQKIVRCKLRYFVECCGYTLLHDCIIGPFIMATCCSCGSSTYTKATYSSVELTLLSKHRTWVLNAVLMLMHIVKIRHLSIL